MAIDTINVTHSVSKVMQGMWTINLNLSCLDTSVEVINESASIRYKEGQNIDTKQAEALNKLQAIIDDYNGEEFISNHAKMANLITYLETNLTG